MPGGDGCTHPNCERHGKSPVVGIGCDGRDGQAERRRAIQAHLVEWGVREELSFPAVSQPLTGSEGQAGVPVTPQGSGEAPGGAERVVGYRPLELGEQARHTEALAGALRETWMAGEQLNLDRPVGERIDWLRFAHGVEQRLAGLNDREPGPAEPFAPVRAPVDTVERGARAMFAVTNRADDWDEPSIPEDLREHYRRLARAVLEAVVRGARGA
jgi:hypothetical protein